MISNIALGIIYKDDAWSLAQTAPAYANVFRDKVILNFGAEQPPVDAFWDVCTAPWPNDYAAARNSLLKYVQNFRRATWLLMLDADEAMFPDDLVSLSRWVESCTADAVYFPRINFVRDAQHWLPGNYPDYQTRLIRLGSDVHYVNAVHECSAGAKPRVMAPYHIYHYGLCRPAQHVFERWRAYAALAGKQAPAIMPPNFDAYGGLGRQEAWAKEHPLQGASGVVRSTPASDAQQDKTPAQPRPLHRPRYTPYRLR